MEHDSIGPNCEIILFAPRISSGPPSSVGDMIFLLSWAALLWTVNSIPYTLGMAVGEQKGRWDLILDCNTSRHD